MSSSHNFSPEEQAYLSKAQLFCDRQEQCPSTVMNKLRSWGASQEVAERIMDSLVADDWLNPQRYCRLYAQSKLHQQKWGRIKIAYHLRSRQLDSALIKQALDSIDPEQYRQTLHALAGSKQASIHDSDPYRRRMKLASFLASHGFTQEEIAGELNDLEL